MEALRYIEKITTDSIVIRHVEKYIGQDVEIIVIPLGKKTGSEEEKTESVMGIFQKYGNPDLIKEEKKAWAKAVQRKHGIS